MATTLMHTTDPFLCVDLDVRARYHAAGGMLRRRLEHLIWIARNLERHVDYRLQALRVVPEGVVRPDLRPDEGTYCFLAYLLTGDEDFAVAARKQLRAVADGVSRRERTDSAQMHTHCDAFPMARWLLLYDWVHPPFLKKLFEKLQSQLQASLLYLNFLHLPMFLLLLQLHKDHSQVSVL